MKNILFDDEDIGDNILFDDEESNKSIKEESIIESLSNDDQTKFYNIVDELQNSIPIGYKIVVNETTDTITIQKPEKIKEPELTQEDKIDYIYNVARRSMQELDELRQHIFEIEKSVNKSFVKSILLFINKLLNKQ